MLELGWLVSVGLVSGGLVAGGLVSGNAGKRLGQGRQGCFALRSCSRVHLLLFLFRAHFIHWLRAGLVGCIEGWWLEKGLVHLGSLPPLLAYSGRD